MLGDTETEVAGLREVALSQLEFLDTETTLQDLLSLWTTDGDVDGNLFVTTDTEGTDGVAGLAYSVPPVSPCSHPSRVPFSIPPVSSQGRFPSQILSNFHVLLQPQEKVSRFGNWARTVNWSLTGKLFQHLCGTGESVTRFTDTDVEDKFVDPQLTHGVARLRVGLLRK